MTIRNTQKVLAARGIHAASATVINKLNLLVAECPEGAFWALRWGYATCGYTLQRTDPKDGRVYYWAQHRRVVHNFFSMKEAGLFLAEIGGQL